MIIRIGLASKLHANLGNCSQRLQDAPSAFPEPPALIADQGGLRLWAKTDAAFAVPRTVRFMVKDKAAFRASAQKVLAWPIKRVLVAHNSVIDGDAHAGLKRALEVV